MYKCKAFLRLCGEANILQSNHVWGFKTSLKKKTTFHDNFATTNSVLVSRRENILDFVVEFIKTVPDTEVDMINTDHHSQQVFDIYGGYVSGDVSKYQAVRINC